MQHWQLGPIGLDWTNQLVLNLILDYLQPLLGASGAALEALDLGFELVDPILGRGEPQARRQVQKSPAVAGLVGHAKAGIEHIPPSTLLEPDRGCAVVPVPDSGMPMRCTARSAARLVARASAAIAPGLKRYFMASIVVTLEPGNAA